LQSLNKIHLNPSPIDKRKAKYFISDIRKLASTEGITNYYEASFNLEETVKCNFFYFGDLDNHGKFHGQATLKTATKSPNGFLNRFSKIFGTFVGGVLQGLVMISSSQDGGSTYFIVQDGVIHSLVIRVGLRPVYDTLVTDLRFAGVNVIQMLAQSGIGYIAKFKSGKPEGPVWMGLIGEPIIGQGFLYGKLNSEGKLTGDNIAYIYPDYLTALIGTFEDKIMKSAREVKITQVTCQDGLLHAKFSEPDENSIAFFYDRATNESIASPGLMLARDPYELKTVEVRESTIPGSGHGLVAARNILKGQVLSLLH